MINSKKTASGSPPTLLGILGAISAKGASVNPQVAIVAPAFISGTAIKA